MKVLQIHCHRRKNVSRLDASSEKNPSQAIFPALELQPTRELTILWGVFRSV